MSEKTEQILQAVAYEERDYVYEYQHFHVLQGNLCYGNHVIVSLISRDFVPTVVNLLNQLEQESEGE